MRQIPEVREVMTITPHTISHDQSLSAAAARMAELDIRHLPVLYGNRFLGVLSDRDVRLARALETQDGKEPNAGDLCIQDCYTVTPDTRLDEVVSKMGRERIDSVIIADGGQLLGILTTADVCRQFGDILRSMVLSNSNK